MRLKNMISNLSDNRWLPIDDDALSGLEMYGEIAESLEELVEQWNGMDKLTEDKVKEYLDVMKGNGDLSDLINHVAIPELYHRRIKFYKTYADMIADDKIIEGQCVKTLGYYEVNDGGGEEYIYQGGEFIVKKTRESNPLIPFKLKGELDYTQAIQRIVDIDRPVLIKESISVSDTIVLKPDSKILGSGKDGALLTNTSDKVLFSYKSKPTPGLARDMSAGLTFQNLNVKTKNFFEFNDRNDIFAHISAIKGGVISNCKIVGRYNEVGDPQEATSTLPTLGELQGYGVGIQATKIFNMCIENCEIDNFGVGIDFLGCDINKIDNCRLNGNARHYHEREIQTFCSQNKIKNCDILHHRRKGAIYIENTKFTTIDDNYFESYEDCGTFIITDGGYGHLIINNRFDDTGKTTIPMATFESRYGINFSNNRFNKSGTPSFIEFLPTHYSVYFSIMGQCKNNDADFIFKLHPAIRTGDLDKSLYNFNTGNVNIISGQLTANFPFVKLQDKWMTKRAEANCLLFLEPKLKTGNYELVYTNNEDDGQFFINIFADRYGGKTIHSGMINKNSHLKLTTDADVICVEFLAQQTQLKSIGLLSVI